MKNSSPLLIAVGMALCFVSAFGGALLALQIDDPEVVVTERVVEVTPPLPDLTPLPEAMKKLAAEWVERTGSEVEEEYAMRVVSEIAYGVCSRRDEPPSIYLEQYESDPAFILKGPELLDFVALVESECRPA